MINFKKNGVELNSPEWDMLKAEISMETESITQNIERAFGPIAQGYSLAINFISTGGPVTQVNNSLMRITIHLPEYVMDSDDNSKYQRKLNLSHELVHTITPNENSSSVTVLEEGLATYFSEEYTGHNGGAPENYANAYNLVSQLLRIDRAIIKKLRQRYTYKKISEYTMEDLLSELCQPECHLAQLLSRPFYDGH